jgi:hypothetical protein
LGLKYVARTSEVASFFYERCLMTEVAKLFMPKDGIVYVFCSSLGYGGLESPVAGGDEKAAPTPVRRVWARVVIT